ncbi:hypothetical protein Dimus_030423 [Dionaea muscipula]
MGDGGDGQAATISSWRAIDLLDQIIPLAAVNHSHWRRWMRLATRRQRLGMTNASTGGWRAVDRLFGEHCDVLCNAEAADGCTSSCGDDITTRVGLSSGGRRMRLLQATVEAASWVKRATGLLPLSPVRVAPPTWLRRRDDFLEGWEEGIRVAPARLARKIESTLLRSRILMKKLDQASMEDGDLSLKLGRRRSRRLATPVPPFSSDPGEVGGLRFSSIAEHEGLEDDVVCVQRDSALTIGVTRCCSQSRALSSETPLTMVAVELTDGMVNRESPLNCESDLSFDLLRIGALADGVFIGPTPPVLNLSPACPSADSSGGLRKKMNDDDDGVVGAGAGFQVSSFTCDLPSLEEEAGTSRQDSGVVCADDRLSVGSPVEEHPCDGSGCRMKLVTDSVGSGSSLVPCAGVALQCPSLVPSDTVVVGLSTSLCGGGLVSEEGRVLPVAREALRPQPTDGLRQPSSATVEPVSAAESRGDSGELAPSTRLRREGSEAWLGVLPERCALKRKTSRLIPRRLLEKMVRGTAEDGDYRVRVECRRSCRLSPSLPSIPQALTGVLEDGLSPIAEGVESIRVIRSSVEASVEDPVKQAVGVVDGDLIDGRQGEKGLGSAVVADSTYESGVSQAMVEGCCQREGIADSPSKVDDSMAMLEGSCQRFGDADVTVHGEHGLPCPAAVEVSPPSMVVGGVVPPSSVTLCHSHADQAGSPSLFPYRAAAALSVDGGVVPALSLAGEVRPVSPHAARSFPAAVMSSGCMEADFVFDSDGGGMVREEGRAPPVAKEAVGPQPADGLRQLPRSSVEPLPVSEAVTAAGGESGRSAPADAHGFVLSADWHRMCPRSEFSPTG